VRVKLVIPSRLLADWEGVDFILARGREGSMGIGPRRRDFVSPLVPGILEIRKDGRATDYVALDGGLLVKCGSEVTVAAGRAVKGKDLESLRDTVEEEFEILDAKEKEARLAMANLESRFVRRFVEQRRSERR
jgi:F-type H+-transporting ATPase subunit epsilon